MTWNFASLTGILKVVIGGIAAASAAGLIDPTSKWVATIAAIYAVVSGTSGVNTANKTPTT